ncbi:MAG TPA: hypothetical protein VMB84_09120, partial [Stellaceae bacterium]|nr:hypothetical protein [Stellaceae bacterium]
MRSRYVTAIFWVTAFIVFDRFFLLGRIAMPSTDQLFAHYPNLVFGYRALRSGELPLWNPYIFAGTDFTESMHNHMLDPLNWLLLTVPEAYIFHLLTLLHFVELALVGVLGFKIARIYLIDAWAALFVALTLQLSQFPWFTMTTLIGAHLLVLALVGIYLILTWQQRSLLASYVLLSLCFFEIFVKGHVGYVAAFGLPVIIAFGVTAWP